MNTIDRSNPIATRLLSLMSKDEGWSARWLGNPDWLNHSSGLIVARETRWTRYPELDPDPPHLTIYLCEGSHVYLPLFYLPLPRWPWQTPKGANPSDPYLIAFNRLSALTQGVALDRMIPA